MPDRARAILKGLFDAAIEAVLPETCLPPALPLLPRTGRLILLAGGKAAAAMARTALDHYDPDGALARTGRLAGLVTTRYGYGSPVAPLPLLEAGHPVPDQNSVIAAEQTLALAQQAGPGDLVLVLLSGGASALWCAPAPGLSLKDKIALTADLLASGADIATVNTFRRAASRIKGGRLALAAHPARVITLAISDVVGDNPEIIGSGPTVPAHHPAPDLARLSARFALEPAAPVLSHLKAPPATGPAFDRDQFRIVATSQTALRAAQRAARQSGFSCYILEDTGLEFTGPPQEIVRQHLKFLSQLPPRKAPFVLLSGGEAVVEVKGNGRGGPNQEVALALAAAFGERPGISALVADTDGTDGGTGAPDDPAGAFLDDTTLARARALGLDPAAHLANNDSTGFFEKLGDLLVTGPIRTNVNDFRAILVDP